MADTPTYCRVLPTFWTDPKVKRKLTRDQKHLLLYLFTSPHTNMVGLYYLPLAYAESESDLPRSEILEYLRGPLVPFVTYDEETEEVLVHRAARHNIGHKLHSDDNRTKAVNRLLRDVHSARLVARFCELYPTWPLEQTAPAAPPSDGPELPSSGAETKGAASPSSSPLHSPSEAIAEAVDIAGTEHTTANPPPTRAPAREEQPNEPADLIDDGDVGRSISLVMMAANEGMKKNPHIGTAFNPIPANHGSRQDVLEWFAAGVTADVAKRAVFKKARDYEPGPRHRQINTMRYFTDAVHEEHDRVSVSKNGDGDHGSDGSGSARKTPRGTGARSLGKAGERRRRTG